MTALFRHLKDSAYELKNVTWPTTETLISMTTLVIVFVVISSLLLGLIDFGFTSGYQYLLGLN